MFPTDRFLGRGEVLGHGASSLTAIPQRREQSERREKRNAAERRGFRAVGFVPRVKIRRDYWRHTV